MWLAIGAPGDRQFLLELGLKGWWVALVTLALLIPTVIFEQDFKMLIASILRQNTRPTLFIFGNRFLITQRLL